MKTILDPARAFGVALFAIAFSASALAQAIIDNSTYVGTGTIAVGNANTGVTIAALNSSIVVNGTAANFIVAAPGGGTPAGTATTMPRLTVNVQSASTSTSAVVTTGNVTGANVYNNGLIEIRNTGGNVAVTPVVAQVVSSTIWSGGEISLYRGTLAEGTVIKSGGLMVLRAVAATANHTTIETGGILQVGYANAAPGGMATNTTINGGLLTVLHYGSASTNDGRGSVDGVTINNGGQLWVGAQKTSSAAVYVKNINIASGEMDIWNNVAGANNDIGNVTLGAGGVMRVLGTAEGFIPGVNFDPSILYAGATITNLTLNGGKILLRDDASVPYTLPAGTNLARLVTSSTSLPNTFAAAKTLNIKGTLSGTATIFMGADLAAGTGDKIVISGSAFGKLNVAAVSSSAPTGNTVYGFVSMDKNTADSSPALAMSGTVWYNSASGATSQALAIGFDAAGNKYLGLGYQPPTPWYENAASNAYAAAVADWYAGVQPLINRMGELRLGTDSGVWVTGNGRKQQIRAAEDTDADVWAYDVQLGADYVFKRARGKTYLGLVGSYTTATQTLHAYGQGDSATWGGGVYVTNFWNNGWYFDFLGKYQKQHQKMTIITPLSSAGESLTYDMPGQSFSFEFGKGFHTKRAYIEPQAQVTFLRTQSVDYNNSRASYAMDASTPIVSRVGLLIARPVNLKTPVTDYAPIARPYVRVSIINFSNAKNNITVTPITDPNLDPQPSHSWQADSNGTGVEGTLGINARFSKYAQLYAEAATNWGGKVETPLSLTAGLRLNF